MIEFNSMHGGTVPRAIYFLEWDVDPFTINMRVSGPALRWDVEETMSSTLKNYII